MAMFGIRDALKSSIKKVFGDASPPPPAVARPPVTPFAERQAGATRPVPVADPVVDDVADAPVAAIAPEVDEAPQASAPTDAGDGLQYDQVWELLDEMVRPALQGDGGDIKLLKVEENNVYVQLTGACSTCPSSIMTMKMGVEALLREEFPQMVELIQVDG